MAIGDIGSIIKSLTYDPTFSYYPRIGHAAGDIYLIANGQDIGHPFYVRSVSIDSLGNIGAGDYLQLATSSGGAGGIVHVNGDVYAVAFIAGPYPIYPGSMKALVKTFTCDSAGNIGAAEIDNIDLSPEGVAPTSLPHIIHVSGNVFAVAYSDNVADGWLKTITINDDGFIDDAPLDSWEFNATEGTRPFILHCGGTLYALIYSGSGDEGYLKTFSIADNGTIDPGSVLALTIDHDFHGGMILPLAGDNYAIFYQAADSDGWVTTVNFDGSAQPTKTKTWEFTTYGTWPMTVEVSDNLAGNGKVFCVLHGTYGDYNNLATIEVLNDGTITESLKDTAQIDAVRVSTGGIVHIAGDIYAAAYRGDGNDGLLKTFNVTTLELPAVTTDPASSVEATTATLNGTLDADGGMACDVRFQWGKTDAYGTNTDWQSGKESVIAFEQAITGLLPNTTYHFRAQAKNSLGTVNGDDATFTTEVAAPTVTTQEMTDVEPTTATGNGTVTDLGGESLTQYGHCWSTSHNPTTSNEKTELGVKSETGVFTSSLTGLSPNTLYYCRAYATNSAGTSYGDEVSFTTEVDTAEVTTDAATDIKETSATLNGTLVDDGGEACSCRFQYGFTADYGNNTDWQAGLESPIPFSQAIAELAGGTLYHFRAQARNSAGTVNGNDRTLTTITSFVKKRAHSLARDEL